MHNKTIIIIYIVVQYYNRYMVIYNLNHYLTYRLIVWCKDICRLHNKACLFCACCTKQRERQKRRGTPHRRPPTPPELVPKIPQKTKEPF